MERQPALLRAQWTTRSIEHPSWSDAELARPSPRLHCFSKLDEDLVLEVLTLHFYDSHLHRIHVWRLWFLGGFADVARDDVPSSEADCLSCSGNFLEVRPLFNGGGSLI